MHMLQGHAAAITHITINERSNQIISLSSDKVIKVPLLLASCSMIHAAGMYHACILNISRLCLPVQQNWSHGFYRVVSGGHAIAALHHCFTLMQTLYFLPLPVKSSSETLFHTDLCRQARQKPFRFGKYLMPHKPESREKSPSSYLVSTAG